MGQNVLRGPDTAERLGFQNRLRSCFAWPGCLLRCGQSQGLLMYNEVLPSHEVAAAFSGAAQIS